MWTGPIMTLIKLKLFGSKTVGKKKKNSNMKEKISCEMILSQYCFCTFMTSSAVLRKEDIYTTQLYLYSFTILQLLASIFILNTFL